MRRLAKYLPRSSAGLISKVMRIGSYEGMLTRFRKGGENERQVLHATFLVIILKERSISNSPDFRQKVCGRHHTKAERNDVEEGSVGILGATHDLWEEAPLCFFLARADLGKSEILILQAILRSASTRLWSLWRSFGRIGA